MRFSKVTLAILGSCSFGLLFSAPSLDAQYKVVTVTDGGSITGVVKFIGLKMTEKLDVTKDLQHCGSSKTSPHLTVGKNGGVQGAVVIVEGIKEGKAAAVQMKAIIDQLGCEYVPHVQAVLVGTQLEVSNSDPVLHNVHAYDPKSRTLFNIAQPIKGQRTSNKRMIFQEPGVHSFVCDAGHIWMSAYVVAIEHPYFALTDENGNFRIEDVPHGSYRIKMWHEGFQITKKDVSGGKVVKYHFEEPYQEIKEVTIKPKGQVMVNFELKSRQH